MVVPTQGKFLQKRFVPTILRKTNFLGDFPHKRKENISTRQSGWNGKKKDIYSIWATVDPTQSVDPSSPTSAPPHSVSSTVLTVLTWCYTTALIIIILIIFPLNVSIDNPIIYLFAHLLLYLALLLEYLFSNFQTPASIVNFLSFLEWQISENPAHVSSTEPLSACTPSFIILLYQWTNV